MNYNYTTNKKHVFIFLNIITIVFLTFTPNNNLLAKNKPIPSIQELPIESSLPEHFSLKRGKTYNFPMLPKTFENFVFANGSYFATLDTNKLYEFTLDDKKNEVVIKAIHKLHTDYQPYSRDTANQTIGWDGTYFYSYYRENLNKYKLINGRFYLAGSTPFPDPIKKAPKLSFYKNKVYSIKNSGNFITRASISFSEYTKTPKDKIIKNNEISFTNPSSGLTTADGRVFSLSSTPISSNNNSTKKNKPSGLVELTSKNKNYYKIKDLKSHDAGFNSLVFNGTNFLTLTKEGVVILEVVPEPEFHITNKLDAYVVNGERLTLEGFKSNEKFQNHTLFWDGSSIWISTSQNNTPGFYRIDADSGEILSDFAPIKKGAEFYKFITYLRTSSWKDGKLYITGFKKNMSDVKEHYLLTLYPYNDRSTGIFFKVISAELLPITDKKISAITFAGDKLIIATGQNTMSSGEGHYFFKLKKEKNKWVIANKYDNPSIRTEGLTWDGEFLWSFDTFYETLYKHRLDKHLTLIEKTSGYRKKTASVPVHSIYNGLTWDGNNLWAIHRWKHPVKLKFKDQKKSTNKNKLQIPPARIDMIQPNLVFNYDLPNNYRNKTYRAGEVFPIKFKVLNRGKGSGDNIKVIFTGDQELINAFKSPLGIGLIPAGKEKEVTFHGTLPLNLTKKTLTVKARLVDAYGNKSKNSETIKLPISGSTQDINNVITNETAVQSKEDLNRDALIEKGRNKTNSIISPVYKKYKNTNWIIDWDEIVDIDWRIRNLLFQIENRNNISINFEANKLNTLGLTLTESNGTQKLTYNNKVWNLRKIRKYLDIAEVNTIDAIGIREDIYYNKKKLKKRIFANGKQGGIGSSYTKIDVEPPFQVDNNDLSIELSSIYEDYIRIFNSDFLDNLFLLDKSIRNIIPKLKLHHEPRFGYSKKNKPIGLYLGHYSDLYEYDGRFLWFIYLIDPNSKYKPYTDYLETGVTGYCWSNKIEIIGKLEQYISHYPKGPFIKEALGKAVGYYMTFLNYIYFNKEDRNNSSENALLNNDYWGGFERYIKSMDEKSIDEIELKIKEKAKKSIDMYIASAGNMTESESRRMDKNLNEIENGFKYRSFSVDCPD